MQPVSSTCSSQSSNPCSRPHRTPLPALRGPVVSQSRSRGHTPHCGKTVWGGEGEEVYAIVERVGSDATEGILCMFTHNNTCTSFPFQPNAALMHLVKCCLPADQCSTHKLRTNWNDTHIQTSKDTHSPKHSHIYSIPQHTHISTQSPTHSHFYSIPNTLTFLLNPQHTHISTQSPTHSHIYSIPNTLTYLLNPQHTHISTQSPYHPYKRQSIHPYKHINTHILGSQGEMHPWHRR